MFKAAAKTNKQKKSLGIMCRRVKRLTGMWAPMAARALMQNGARNTMKDMNNKAAAIMDSLDCSCERDAPIWPVVT